MKLSFAPAELDTVVDAIIGCAPRKGYEHTVEPGTARPIVVSHCGATPIGSSVAADIRLHDEYGAVLATAAVTLPVRLAQHILKKVGKRSVVRAASPRSSQVIKRPCPSQRPGPLWGSGPCSAYDDDLGIPPYAPGIICPFLCRLFGPIWAVQDRRYYQLLRQHN